MLDCNNINYLIVPFSTTDQKVLSSLVQILFANDKFGKSDMSKRSHRHMIAASFLFVEDYEEAEGTQIVLDIIVNFLF